MSKDAGKFITFEGIEGSGKSTHSKAAVHYLKRQGHDVLFLREPGGTTIGEQIRDVLLNKDNRGMTVECELLLYNAARVQLIKEIIAPALAVGKVVVCDRYIDSTSAYQCYGGKLKPQVVDAVNTIGSVGIVPDITFLLDSDVKRGLERAGRGDRMELKSFTFHKRVRKGFLTIAKKNPDRFCVLDEVLIAKGKIIIEKRLDVLFA